MARETIAGEQFVAELRRLGVARVRQRQATGAWGRSGRKAKLAELWLAEQDRARALAAAEAERADIVRGAEDATRRAVAAAERSADLADAAHATAKDANVRAALALAIAAASLIVQLMLAYVRPS